MDIITSSHIHAEFASSAGAQLRQDTRVYRTAGSFAKATGRCLGIVWLCNPGSATGSSVWGPCSSDPTLDVIVEVFTTADGIAKASGRPGAAPTDYLQILNLHYVCDTSVLRGWHKSFTLPLPLKVENPSPKALFCWLAWGDVPQALLLHSASLFSVRTDILYYDADRKLVQTQLSKLNYPVHPYGARRHSRSHPCYVDLLAAEIARRLP
jgi:hypothetical protein